MTSHITTIASLDLFLRIVDFRNGVFHNAAEATEYAMWINLSAKLEALRPYCVGTKAYPRLPQSDYCLTGSLALIAQIAKRAAE
jgi:hypothetical protein